MLPEEYTRCDNIAFANFVAAISHTNSNQFEFVRLIAATKFCRSDNDFHKINRVTRCELSQRLVPATCRSDLSPSVSLPLDLVSRNVALNPDIQISAGLFISADYQHPQNRQSHSINPSTCVNGVTEVKP